MDDNIKKILKGIKLDNLKVENLKVQNLRTPESYLIKSQNQMEENIRQLHLRKEAEKERQHKEVVEAINNAAKDGATIIIGDNANGINIQNGTTNSILTTAINTQTFNYENVIDVLKEIKEYFGYPQFTTTFGDNSDKFKKVVEDTINAAEKKEDPSKIKKSLQVLKDLAVGVTGSLIASGIIKSLTTLLTTQA